MARFATLFFFNDTATTEIYTLSLHDALPIWMWAAIALMGALAQRRATGAGQRIVTSRSEEHTSELQSQSNLVCRLLLEKKKKITLPVCALYHERCTSMSTMADLPDRALRVVV